MATKDVAEQFVQRLGAGDAEGLGDLFTESIDWRVPLNEKLPWTGTRSQKSDVPEYFRTLWAGLEPGKSIVDFDTILVDGDDVVLLAHFSHMAAPTGKRFDTDVAMRLTVSDGKITRLHLYEDTFAVDQAFKE
ncbi:nuclear transport factor 2 family protein [Arthrobacter crusticola]|uniref:Nuclear transport factor 2 family protein n=1 Tax=Arthrobacter crusticola TaxID=2547960 RepID=A0A4R5TMR8_9MICC|nr:nuclear transport factor 2 family protein [Arthrobacter crusticola]TDK23911.1 nuclear transport factor 2 family protein [Arthrobacter crusticola]